MTGAAGIGRRRRREGAGPAGPTLEPNERRWLDGYLERLRSAPGGFLKRLVVYGSKARGDPRADSDLDVLVLVDGGPASEEEARRLVYAGDDPGDVDHQVVIQTEWAWLRGIEMELPFPRNVESEGIQLHPEYRPARMPPNERPPVTRVGIGNAVPVWMKNARSRVRLAVEIAGNERTWGGDPGSAAQPAFDAVFLAAMAWCLTLGVSVVRRRDLPTTIERHLIATGRIDTDWSGRIRTLWSAWRRETAWRPDSGPEPTRDDASAWAETAQDFVAAATGAIETAGVELNDDDAGRTDDRRPCDEGTGT